jgi:hypothetical protein
MDGDDEDFQHPASLPAAKPELNWGLDIPEPDTIAALELHEKKLYLDKRVQGYGSQRAGQSIGWSPYRTAQMEKDPEIQQLLAIIEDMKDEDVERAMYIAAKSGNVTAGQFWLLNRRPDRWRDTKRIVVDHNERVSIEVVHSVKQSALELLQMTGVKALQPGGALGVIDAEIVEDPE